MTYTVKKRRLKKPLRYGLIILVTLILTFFLVRFAYDQYGRHQLQEIGYQSTSISAIDKYNLRNTLIKRGEYSQSLEEALLADSVFLDYLDIYFIRDEVTLEITHIYQRLLDNGYPPESLQLLFADLQFRELTPLLVFDYQEDVTMYIADVIANRETNINKFELDNDYYTHYENTVVTDISKNYEIFVSKTYELPREFEVELVNVSVGCRMQMMQLEKETAAAFETLCADMQSLGMKIASTSAYRSYETQQNLYDSILLSYGEERGEQRVARAGFSEHETGLAVDIASLTTPDVTFVNSKESDWLKENAHHYGFINHYQEGYQQITGVQYESWHYRYLGIELASKVYESGLTYDEYYLLYLIDSKEVNTNGD